MKAFATLALIAALPLLAACGRDSAPDPAAAGQSAGNTAPSTALGRTVARAMDEARRELREGDMSLNGEFDIHVGGQRIRRTGHGQLPSAAITPEGSLVVSGSPVPMDDASRALALAHREALIAVAESGMDLGVRGADLGMRAARDAIGSLFRGDTEGMEARIEAEAKTLEAAAMQLCKQLPRLLETQQALAAAVPEFVPYARMTASDIDDCREGEPDSAHAQSPTADASGAMAMEDAVDGLDAAARADAAAATHPAAPADPTR